MPEINLLPDQVNLTFMRGTELDFDVVVTDHLGAAVTLGSVAAGMGRTATVAGSARPAPLLDTSVSGNTVRVRLAAAATARLASGFWELRASANGAPVRPLASGLVTVRV